jgi:hypothetical protein
MWKNIVELRFPTGAKVQTGSVVRQPLTGRVTEVLSRGQNGRDVKQTAHHLLPLKNQWSYIYSSIRLHDVCADDNFTVTFLHHFTKRRRIAVHSGTAIWRMHIACWMPKATNAHTQVV